jgi:hypothetical protein
MLEYFSYSDINKIKETPGCYCWYIDWTKIRRKDFENDIKKRVDLVNAIFKVFTPNPIFVNATRKINSKNQYFGENYEGTLEHKGNRINNLNSKLALDYNLFLSFLDFTQSLIIPLYIGKSKNLNRRIKQHVEYLEDAKAILNFDIETFEKEELKNFSERFSMITKDCSNLGLRTNMLSVKLVYLEEDSITEFESNLNYLYKPLFGIK